MSDAEDRIYLPHFSKGMAGRVVTKGHGNFTDLNDPNGFDLQISSKDMTAYT